MVQSRGQTRKFLILFGGLAIAFGLGANFAVKSTGVDRELFQMEHSRTLGEINRLQYDHLVHELNTAPFPLAQAVLNFASSNDSTGSAHSNFATEIPKITWTQAPRETLEFTGVESKLSSWIRDHAVIATLSKNDFLLERLKFPEGPSREALIWIIKLAPDSYRLSLYAPGQLISGVWSTRPGYRSYLLSQEGKVLAHSQKSWIGTSLSKVAVFKENLEQVFRGQSQNSGPAKESSLESMDRTQVEVAYRKVGNLPYLFVTEKLVDPSLVRAQGALLKKGLGLGVGSLGSLLFLELFLGLFLFRRQKTSPSAVPSSRLVAAVPPPFVPAVPPPQAAIPSTATSASGATHAGLGPILPASAYSDFASFEKPEPFETEPDRERKILENFEASIRTVSQLKILNQRLVEAIASLYESQALFFRYNEPAQALILDADSVSPSSTGLTAAGFGTDFGPVPIAATKRLLEVAEVAQKIGFSRMVADDENLSRAMLARFGSAFFEAWTLTGYGNLGRMAKKSKLLGVVVIPSPEARVAVRTDAIRTALQQMLRSAGLIYENILLSQIGPKLHESSRDPELFGPPEQF